MSQVDLKQFGLLAELDEVDREALFEVLEERKASSGVPLFREGSEAEGLVLLVAGEVELKSRRSAETARLGPGSTIGALSLLVVGPREVSAIAQAPCRYLLFPRTSYRRLVDDAPRTACRLTEAIIAELSAAIREGLDVIASA